MIDPIPRADEIVLWTWERMIEMTTLEFPSTEHNRDRLERALIDRDADEHSGRLN